jgi:hypothetical protein
MERNQFNMQGRYILGQDVTYTKVCVQQSVNRDDASPAKVSL